MEPGLGVLLVHDAGIAIYGRLLSGGRPLFCVPLVLPATALWLAISGAARSAVPAPVALLTLLFLHRKFLCMSQ